MENDNKEKDSNIVNATPDEEKNIKEVKSIGKFFKIFGLIKVVFGIGIVLFFMGNSDILSLVSFGYSDAAPTIIIGALWIILGGRIAKDINSNTKKYLLTIFWLLIITGGISFLVNVAEGGRGTSGIVLTVFLAFYANKGIKKLKQIDTKNSPAQYKLQGWKWIWFILASILLFIVSAFFEVESMPASSKAGLINETVNSAKSSVSLPHEIDSATALVDITAESEAIRFHYAVDGVDMSKVSNDDLKNLIYSEVCDNKDNRNLLDQGINLEYSYVAKGQPTTLFFYFTKEDCSLGKRFKFEPIPELEYLGD